MSFLLFCFWIVVVFVSASLDELAQSFHVEAPQITDPNGRQLARFRKAVNRPFGDFQKLSNLLCGNHFDRLTHESDCGAKQRPNEENRGKEEKTKENRPEIKGYSGKESKKKFDEKTRK